MENLNLVTHDIQNLHMQTLTYNALSNHFDIRFNCSEVLID